MKELTLEEKIEVMQAFKEGKEVEVICLEYEDTWDKASDPCWNWDRYSYRVKPEEKEVDWSKVEKGTPILVKKADGSWVNGFFIKESFAGIYFSRFLGNEEHYGAYTSEVKLDPEPLSIINWIPNTEGKEPEGKWFAELSTGNILNYSGGSMSAWRLDYPVHVTRYFLIP